MIIEEVKTEYTRIRNKIKVDILTAYLYDKHSKPGYRTRDIKKQLGLTFNKMKIKAGIEIASTKNNGAKKKSSKKILCERGYTKEISISDCIPGCNDACLTCSSKQFNNISASDDTLTPEDDREAMLAGTWGSSSAIAVNEGHSEI